MDKKSDMRWPAIDCLRGIAIFFMAIVNHPGSDGCIFSPLSESDWIGKSPADLIFPTFIFVMGISIVLAFNRLAEPKLTKVLFYQIMKRAILLFLIGILIHVTNFWDWPHVRIPGVLQRIAIVYACCSLLYFELNTNKLMILSCLILVFYWILLVFVPVPGFEFPSLMMPDKNIAAWFDSYILSGHMLKSTLTWDPEGILSTMPAIVTGILGMIVGEYLIKNYHKDTRTIVILCVSGVAMVLLGFAWGYSFPIIKKIWTSSFVLWAGGWATLILALLLYLIDIKKFEKFFYVFIAIGKNALFLYILEELIGRIFISPISMFENYLQILLPGNLRSMVFALTFGLIIMTVGIILDKKSIYFKV